MLSVDITGPLVKGWDYGTGRQAKYALLATVPIPVMDGQLHAEGDQPPCDVLPGPEVQRSEEVHHAGQVPRSGGDDSPKECLPGSGAHGEKVHAGHAEPVPSKGDGCDDEKDGGKLGDALPADPLARLPELGEKSKTLRYLKEKMGDSVKIKKTWGEAEQKMERADGRSHRSLEDSECHLV